MQDRLMEVSEVAQYLGISKRTLYRHLREEGLPAYRLGGQWRFKKEKLDEWLEKQENRKK